MCVISDVFSHVERNVERRKVCVDAFVEKFPPLLWEELKKCLINVYLENLYGNASELTRSESRAFYLAFLDDVTQNGTLTDVCELKRLRTERITVIFIFSGCDTMQTLLDCYIDLMYLTTLMKLLDNSDEYRLFIGDTLTKQQYCYTDAVIVTEELRWMEELSTDFIRVNSTTVNNASSVSVVSGLPYTAKAFSSRLLDS